VLCHGTARLLQIEVFFFGEHKELPAKLLDYFLRSNKSNINQEKNMRNYNVLKCLEVFGKVL